MLAVWALLGAFLYRVRGGAIETGHTHIGRGIFAAGFAAVAWYVHRDPVLLILAVLVFIGVVPSAKAAINLFEPRDRIINSANRRLEIAIAVGRSAWFTLPSAVLVNFVIGPWHATLLFAAGLMAIPCYALSWRMPFDWPRIGLGRGPDWGEAFFGAVLFAAIAVRL